MLNLLVHIVTSVPKYTLMSQKKSGLEFLCFLCLVFLSLRFLSSSFQTAELKIRFFLVCLVK